MRPTLAAVCLALTACTPEVPLELPPLGDLALKVETHRRDAGWIEHPLAAGVDAAWQLRSPGLRTYVAPDRLVVIDRAEVDPTWQLELSAAAWGRRGTLRPLPPGRPWAEGPQVDVQRGPVTEWLVNDEEGLEHGFTLHEPPPGSGEVVIALDVRGLEATPMPDGARFVSEAGPRVDWRGLLVTDATGRALPAWTEVAPDRVSVVVDDRGARWPIVVDPMLTSPERQVDLSATGPSPAWTGFSLAGDGDLLLLGNPGVLPGSSTDGVGVMVSRNEDDADEWGVVATLQPGTNEPRIGHSVALSVPIAALSSPQAGKVWVYTNETGSWALEATIDRSSDGGFGTSMDLHGETMVSGWPDDTDGGAQAGSVSVYRRQQGGAGSWGELVTLRRSTPIQGARLGEAVATSNDLIVAGAPNPVGSGFAIVWRYDVSTGDYVEDDELTLSTGRAGDAFGTAVDTDGQSIAVGAPGLERASVFVSEASNWVETVLAPPPEAGPGFGTKVAVKGDTVAVGDLPASGTARVHLYERRGSTWAYVQSLDGGPTTGAAALPIVLDSSLLAIGLPESASLRVYRRTADEWLEAQATGRDQGDWYAGAAFGASLDIEGSVLAVGSPYADEFGPGWGSTHLFTHDGEDWVRQTWLICDPGFGMAGGECGTDVDLNDGLLVLGAPARSGACTSAVHGSAFVYDVSDPSRPAELAEILPDCGTPQIDGLRFGESVALVPPFIAVGTPGRGLLAQGGFQLFARDQDGVGAWGFVLEELGNIGDQTGQEMEASESLLMVAGPEANRSGVDNGVVQVWDLGEDPAELLLSIVGPGPGYELGKGMAVDGNLLAIGAPGFNSDAGRVYVYEVKHDGTATETLPYSQPIATLDGSTIGGRFGESVALAGDRLIVGLPGAGRAEVRLRNLGGADAFGVDRTLGAGATNSEFGASVAAGPNLVAVGEPGWDSTLADEGRVHLYDLTEDLPPVARDDTYTLDEDQSLATRDGLPSLIDNDHEPNGTGLSAVLVSGPSHALGFSLSVDGHFSYQPALNRDSPDSFTYYVTDGVHDSATATVDLLITPVNDAPVATPDAYATIEEGILSVGSGAGVLSNDTDVDDAALTAILDRAPAHGALTLEPNGAFGYTPERDFFGVDSFVYQAQDAQGLRSAPVEVSIDVAPVNDPPVVPTQVVRETLEDVALLEVPPGLLNPAEVFDPDGDMLQTRLSSAATTDGAVQVFANGAWSYTPPPEFSGTDVFQIEVGDGQLWVAVTVLVEVVAVNDPPVGTPDALATPEDRPLYIDPDTLALNDLDIEPGPLDAVLEPTLPPAHGAVTVDPVTGFFVYTPDRDYVGSDSFHYRARDVGGATSDPVPVDVTITPLNDAPEAVDDDLGEAVGTEPLQGNVLANDSDPDGDPVTAELSSPALGGQVSLSPDGSVTYVARPGFVGPDRFLYVAVDGQGGRSKPAAVDVVVLPDGNTTAPGTPPDDTGCEASTWYLDADRDGVGDATLAVEACEAPPQHVRVAGDCDDTRADVFPGAREISGDEVDQDCDGIANTIRPIGCVTTPSSSVGLVLVALLVALAPRARASALCADDTAADVDAAVEGLWDAWKRVDEADFDRASKNIEFAVSCLDVVPTGAQVARLHQAMALSSFVNGQTRASRRSLAAARLADPGWKLPEDRFPPSHPFRDLFAGAGDPGPSTPIGDISPERWVVDGIERDDAPTERAFLLQVKRDDAVVWTVYLWTREEVPDRGQNDMRSPFEAPVAWQLGVGLHGRALSSRQQIEPGTPAAEDASGLGVGGGVELGARFTPSSIVGGEATASIVSGADPVLGGGGSPTGRAVLLVGGGGWLGDLQPWGAARLGAAVDRARAWTYGPADLEVELSTVASAVLGAEGGIRSERFQARLSADVLLASASRPWMVNARGDVASAISEPFAIQGSLDLRASGLPLEDADGAAAGTRSDLDFRVGAALLLWL